MEPDRDAARQDAKLGSPVYSLREQETADMSVSATAPTEYRTYKRRWFGLVQLVLMNIVVSWCVSSESPYFCFAHNIR